MGVVHTFITIFYQIPKRAFFKSINKVNYTFAFDVDVFGNYLFKNTWNAMFSKSGYEFGNFGETLSSVFGKKREENTLTTFGLVMSYILDFLFINDWFKDWSLVWKLQFKKVSYIGHSKLSIMDINDINRIRLIYLK